MQLVGAPATWLLSNHDVTRPVTRYGRQDSSFAFLKKRRGTPSDLALGTQRARAAHLLAAALPGSLYVYQGDELGLEEVDDLPEHQLQDPMFFRSEGVDPGRDGCRVPLPWSGSERPFGFSPAGAEAAPWLQQPETWALKTVDAQLADPGSMLTLYRDSLQIRRTDPDLRAPGLRWLEAPDGVLAFARGVGFVCLTNLRATPLALPTTVDVLIASTPVQDGALSPDASAWIRTDPDDLARRAGWPTREAG